MNKGRFFAIIASALLAGGIAEAQNTSGLLFDRDIISNSSLISLSQRNYMGTARSMAMGGAFTSLGADMASFGVNPAGFGMYQRNEISATLGLGFMEAVNKGATSTSDYNDTARFSFNNVGASFLVYENTGTLTAINFAFGYNKTADYNYDFSYRSNPTVSSMADAFADIANREGLGINADNKICDPNGYANYDMNPYFWTTALAYKGGLINRGSNGWYPDELGNGASMTQQTRFKSRGSASEFSFATGMNFSNFLYFGMTLDVQSISRKQTIYYGEYVDYPAGAPSGADLPYQLVESELGQTTEVSGSGVGAKFGITVRPTKGLRIGVALHTPTYYSVLYRYKAALTSKTLNAGSNPDNFTVSNDGHIYADESTPTLEDLGRNRWQFCTPTRLLAGISYAIGEQFLISADYMYEDFDGIRVIESPVNSDFINDSFNHGIRGRHSVCGGVEVKLVPAVALRAGGGYLSRIVDAEYIFGEPVLNSKWYVSAGIGFRLGRVTSIDIAYQYNKEQYTDYYSFYSVNNIGVNCSPLYGLELTRHNLAVTFGFKF